MADSVDAIMIYAPLLPPPIRHQTIFGVLDALPANQSVMLVNDHDPKPLFYQLEAEQPGVFTFHYVESGPERFAIRITRK